MKRSLLRLLSAAAFSVVAGALLTSQGSVAPAAQDPPPPARGRAGRGIEAQIAMGADFSPKPPVVRLSPAEQQTRFLLPDGYRIAPVLADPHIESPVGVTFDGNGRMYVLEMRSYMQDAEGSNSRAPISRISRHEDTDGDGTYDRSTVFADKLVLPRIAFPLQDGVILVLETDNRDLYRYTDTDGDGVADRRELFYTGFGRVTNMEWQPGGMVWALDNWLYTTYNPFRLRITPDGKLLREETEPNGGQWWAAQDNYGKTWWVDGGAEIGPVNFQVPIAYGAFNVPDNFEPGFQVPWPAAPGIADMQGGMARVRMPEGTLNHFTAASGVEIYRGHRLPDDLAGDLLFGEPVGRIVRRAEVVVTEGLTQLRNVYPKSEFIRSTDPLFRPVNVHNTPDGTLLVVDMYTGIIQDAQFVGPESYLRRKIEQYGLDRLHNFGRIWKVTYEGMAPDRRQPRMYRESAAGLVKHLAHPNGWWRDTAQKLLVLRGDTSVVPALTSMARSGDGRLARIHALWTLEGLGALEAPLVRELMKSPDPQIRIQAIRASETLHKKAAPSFAGDYRAMLQDAEPDVVIQAMLTLRLHDVPKADALIRATSEASRARGVQEIGRQLLQGSRFMGQPPAWSDPGAGVLQLPMDQRRSVARGEAIYREICAACHAPDGSGAPMAGAPAGTKLAPSLAASPRVAGHRDYIIKVLLHGLTGPIGDTEYPGGVMVPMGTNTDEWIADVSSYVRNSFGNRARIVTPREVALVRTTSPRKTMWTLPELEASLPKALTNQSAWKVTASHNADAAANALKPDGRWDTAGAQQPGMWYQIELPEPRTITEVQIDSAVPGARGRGGRRSGPATGPVSYRLQASMDGSSWGEPLAEGPGETPATVVAFAPVRAKFIRITQTGTAAKTEAWAIAQVRVLVPGDAAAGPADR